MSNSYTPGPPSSGNIFQRSSSIDDETEIGSFDDPAPTRSIVGNEPRTVSERNLDGEAYYGQVPSISDVRRDGGISDSGNTGFHQSDAPGISGNVRPNHYSQPGQDNPYSGVGGQAPEISGHARPNHSESAQPSPDHDPSDPQEDYVGVSLVGKKFKEVNPTAYYVEKE